MGILLRKLEISKFKINRLCNEFEQEGCVGRNTQIAPKTQNFRKDFLKSKFWILLYLKVKV